MVIFLLNIIKFFEFLNQEVQPHLFTFLFYSLFICQLVFIILSLSLKKLKQNMSKIQYTYF